MTWPTLLSTLPQEAMGLPLGRDDADHKREPVRSPAWSGGFTAAHSMPTPEGLPPPSATLS